MKDRARRFLSSEKSFVPLLIGLVFFPLFFHGPRFGMPYVKGGDEPHYLAIINSLLIHGNLDVRAAYESAWKGSWQVGKKYAGAAVDPHVSWIIGGKQVTEPEVYEETNKWEKGPDGHYVPKRKPGAPDVTGLPEHPSHPAGIAFLLAPFLWPFRGTPVTEPAALFFSNLAVIFSAFTFRRLLKLHSDDPFTVNLGTLLTVLGTPLWAYGRMLFMEPYLAFFTLAAYYSILGRRSGFWAGMALGIGTLLKPNYLILFFPLALFCLAKKEWKALCWMMVGPFLSAVFILYLNFKMFGSPFTPSIPFILGNPAVGLAGILFSWNHGILAFAPVAAVAGLFWGKLGKEDGAQATAYVLGASLYILMMAAFWCWWGGWCYGPRLVVPVIPLLMVPIVHLPEAFGRWGRPMKILAIGLCILSVAFNLLGAFDGYWDSHPLTLLAGNIS